MACVLSRQNRVFQGTVGSDVRIAVRSNTPAGTVRIVYAGDQDSTPPFTFKIKEGKHKLLVWAVGCESGQKMQVVEVDGRNDCRLRTFFWSGANFFTTLTIEGV